jgi:diaminopimelate epimerase
MISFDKFHGTGNDFFVIDAAQSVTDRRRLAIDLCDRDSGIGDGDGSTGADGVLFLALEAGYASPRVVMTLVQPDGSTAPMCGNGARCAAAWAAERTGEDVVMVDTQSGTRRATVDETVSIEMGIPRFSPEAVPLARDEPLVEEPIGDLDVTAVDTGVPHAVAFVDDVSTIDLESVAPPVRHAEVFPRGANVTVASPDGAGGFDQRTYERGVEGETRSCGTGAVAVGAAARKLGRTEDDSVTVSPPGGELDVEFSGTEAILRGPTEREFAGRVSLGGSRSVEIDGDAGATADD